MVFTSRLSHLLIARVYFEATTASMPNVRFAVRGDENGHTPHADSGTCSFVISVGGKGTVKSKFSFSSTLLRQTLSGSRCWVRRENKRIIL